MTTTPSGARPRDGDRWAPVRTLLWPGGERPRARTLLVDALLWLGLAMPVALNVYGLGFSEELESLALVARLLLWLTVLAVLIVLGRYSPVLSVLAAALCSVAVAMFVPALAVLSYLTGRRSPRVWPSAVGLALLVVGGAVWLLVLGRPLSSWTAAIYTGLPTVLFPWMIGNYRRQHQDLLVTGWERAKQVEREGRIVADEARLRERARIAQDMHDSLGHELSLIALRAGALEVAPDLEERYRTAAGELRAGAMTATDRLREIIGVLRDDADPAPREPADEGIAALVERARASGVEILLVRDGEAADLAPMADRAAYRVVQEGITNATKHAPGAAVQVRVHGSADGSTVSVRNAAPPAGPLPGRSQGGRGLIGLTERVRLAGGTLESRSEDHGAFALVARFPLPDQTLAGAAAPDEVAEGDRFDRDLQLAQRRLRRRLFVMLAVPVAMVVAGVFVAVGLAYYRDMQTALTPAEYADLRVGQQEAAVRADVPSGGYSPSDSVRMPPAPEAARCTYYRSSAMTPGTAFEVYRLCFRDDRLVAKDSYRPDEGASPSPSPTEAMTGPSPEASPSGTREEEAVPE